MKFSSAHQVSESRSFDLAAVGSAGAIRYQINTELSLQATHTNTHKYNPVSILHYNKSLKAHKGFAINSKGYTVRH